MNNQRYGYTVTILKEYIYISGGINEDFAVTSMEKYDPKTDEWEVIMADVSSFQTMIGTENYIYAISYGNVPPMRVDRYDPAENRWTMVGYFSTILLIYC